MTRNYSLTIVFTAYAAIVQKCASFGLHSHPSNGKHRVHDVSMSSSLSSSHSSDDPDMNNRRDFFKLTSKNAVKGTGLVFLNTLLSSTPSQALADRDSDGQLDVDSFLKTGGVSQPMGVSGQAGKSRPELGVIFRDGSDVSRDSRTGGVGAEILVEQIGKPKDDPMAVLINFESPWPLATGGLFDVETRDSNTGDGCYIQVSEPSGKKDISGISNQYILDQIMKPTGRFSFYGTPTDAKVKKTSIVEKGSVAYKFMEIGFSTLSQSTGAEIPRKALVVSTVPAGSENVIMFVSSTTANRWKKVSESVYKTADSFQALEAPKSSLKIRAKPRERFEGY